MAEQRKSDSALQISEYKSPQQKKVEKQAQKEVHWQEKIDKNRARLQGNPDKLARYEVRLKKRELRHLALFEAKKYHDTRVAEVSQENKVKGIAYGIATNFVETFGAEKLRARRLSKAAIEGLRQPDGKLATGVFTTEFVKAASEIAIRPETKRARAKAITASLSEVKKRGEAQDLIRSLAGGKENIDRTVNQFGQQPIEAICQEIIAPLLTGGSLSAEGENAAWEKIRREFGNNPALNGLTKEQVIESFRTLAQVMQERGVVASDPRKLEAAFDSMIYRGKDAYQLEQLAKISKFDFITKAPYGKALVMGALGVTIAANLPAALIIGAGFTLITAIHKLNVDRAMRAIEAQRGEVNIRAKKDWRAEKGVLKKLFAINSNLMNVDWEQAGMGHNWDYANALISRVGIGAVFSAVFYGGGRLLGGVAETGQHAATGVSPTEAHTTLAGLAGSDKSLDGNSNFIGLVQPSNSAEGVLNSSQAEGILKVIEHSMPQNGGAASDTAQRALGEAIKNGHGHITEGQLGQIVDKSFGGGDDKVWRQVIADLGKQARDQAGTSPSDKSFGLGVTPISESQFDKDLSNFVHDRAASTTDPQAAARLNADISHLQADVKAMEGVQHDDHLQSDWNKFFSDVNHGTKTDGDISALRGEAHTWQDLPEVRSAQAAVQDLLKRSHAGKLDVTHTVTDMRKIQAAIDQIHDPKEKAFLQADLDHMKALYGANGDLKDGLNTLNNHLNAFGTTHNPVEMQQSMDGLLHTGTNVIEAGQYNPAHWEWHGQLYQPGLYSHNELTMSINGNTVHFGGNLSGVNVPSHLGGVPSINDPLLEKFAAQLHMHEIPHTYMVEAARLTDGKVILVQMDPNGNALLPPGAHIDYVSSALLIDHGHLVNPQDIVANGGHLPSDVHIVSLASQHFHPPIHTPNNYHIGSGSTGQGSVINGGGGTGDEGLTGFAAGGDKVTDTFWQEVQRFQESSYAQHSAAELAAAIFGFAGAIRAMRDFEHTEQGHPGPMIRSLAVGLPASIGLGIVVGGPLFPAYLTAYIAGTFGAMVAERIGNRLRERGGGGQANPPANPPGGTPPGGGRGLLGRIFGRNNQQQQPAAQQGGQQPGAPRGATPPPAGTYNTPAAAVQAGQAVGQNPNRGNINNLAQQLGAANPNIQQLQLRQQMQSAVNAARQAAQAQNLPQQATQQAIPYAAAAAEMFNNRNPQLDLATADNARAMAAVMLPNGTEDQQKALADAIRRAAVIRGAMDNNPNASLGAIVDEAVQGFETFDGANPDAQHAAMQAEMLHRVFTPNQNRTQADINTAVNQAYDTRSAEVRAVVGAVMADVSHNPAAAIAQGYQAAELTFNQHQTPATAEMIAVAKALDSILGANYNMDEGLRRRAIVDGIGQLGAQTEVAEAQGAAIAALNTNSRTRFAEAARIVGSVNNSTSSQRLYAVVRGLQAGNASESEIRRRLIPAITANGVTVPPIQEATLAAILDSQSTPGERLRLGLDRLSRNTNVAPGIQPGQRASQIADAIISIREQLGSTLPTDDEIRQSMDVFQNLSNGERRVIVARILSNTSQQMSFPDRVNLALATSGIAKRVDGQQLTLPQQSAIAAIGEGLLEYNAAIQTHNQNNPNQQRHAIPNIALELKNAFNLDAGAATQIATNITNERMRNGGQGSNFSDILTAVDQITLTDPNNLWPVIQAVQNAMEHPPQGVTAMRPIPQEIDAYISQHTNMPLDQQTLLYAGFLPQAQQTPSGILTAMRNVQNRPLQQNILPAQRLAVVAALQRRFGTTSQATQDIYRAMRDFNGQAANATARRTEIDNVIAGVTNGTPDNEKEQAARMAVLVAAPKIDRTQGTPNISEVQAVFERLRTKFDTSTIRSAMEQLNFSSQDRQTIVEAYLRAMLANKRKVVLQQAQNNQAQQRAQAAYERDYDALRTAVNNSIKDALAAAGYPAHAAAYDQDTIDLIHGLINQPTQRLQGQIQNPLDLGIVPNDFAIS